MTYWLAKKTVLVKLIFFYLTKHAQYTKKVFFDLQKTNNEFQNTYKSDKK